MSTPLQILEKYWGHKQFRPLQAAIIDAVIAQKDVLALLPTGGGKSISFKSFLAYYLIVCNFKLEKG